MRSLAIVLAGWLGGSLSLAAQDPLPSSHPFEETVQVTASLAEEPVADVSAAVSVVSAEEAEARQATTVLELLATLPGLALTQSGSAGKTASLFSRGTGSNHTLVLWDGVRLNEPFLGGFDWAFAGPEGLERVESVRGPFSALYGSGAVGGVVQLVSSREPGLSGRLEGGSREYGRASLAAGGALGPLFASGHGSLRRGQGTVDNDFFDGEEAALRFDRDERRDAAGAPSPWRIGLAARWQHALLGLPFDYLGTPSPRQRQRSETRQLAVPFGWQGHRLALDGSVARVEQDLTVVDADNPFAASTSEASSDQARAVLRAPVGPRLSFVVGGDWERQRATSGSAFGAGLSGATQRADALFAQVSWRGERARWEAGVRRDDNDAFGGATSYRGGGTLRLAQDLLIRASYGEAFRAPSLADLYYPGFGNPDLAPERSRGAEVGLEATHGGWHVVLTAFETRLKDLVQYDFLLGRPFNTGRARTRGVEGEVRAQRERIWLRASATYLEANDSDTGARLFRRPRLTAALALGARAGACDLDGVVRFVGDRVDVGDVPLASYRVVDVGLTWRRAAIVRPYARVENLFASRYEEAAGFPAPGRTFVAGLTFTGGR
ncbi:MAG: TonB-dependent receptor [Holophagales bacterium]|nr:MAG: TonB-dependent receptor [Holophagales bacterium]